MACMPWSLSSLYRVQALAIEAKHAPPFVRHLETPNRVCVCFYGPSVTQVGTAARGCLLGVLCLSAPAQPVTTCTVGCRRHGLGTTAGSQRQRPFHGTMTSASR
jgi:hypothetical protein